MFRFRKLSKVFHKDSPATTPPQNSPTRPVYRGTKPLTVSDIHSHSPVEQTRPLGDIDYYYDELGTRRSQPSQRKKHLPEEATFDILDHFPAPPPLQAVVSYAHKDGPRLYFSQDDLFSPNDDLLPPPPDKVLAMVKERERALSHEMGRFEKQQQLGPCPITPPRHGASSSRRPLYENSHANMSTRSLGAHANLKAGPAAQRAVVQQPGGHSPVFKQAYTLTSASRASPRPEGRRERDLPSIPEGERPRLRSAPTKLSSRQLAAANQELYRAYPSAFQGQTNRL
ncbi:hypothetical protein K438DRAFT_144651 [Mycena galopus ATCC 62051]|nr:hypothetical protein K438DRAFT_144651 [Mycena galopus ATCC 62051]